MPTEPTRMTPEQIRHAAEQMGAWLREFAGTMASYFKALQHEGFTREEALRLTIAYQATIISGSRPRDPEPPS